MKNLFKVALTGMVLISFVSCMNSRLTMSNEYTEGFYVLDAKTARNISADEIQKRFDNGEIPYLTQEGSQFSYDSASDGTTAFKKYKVGSSYIFCFVSDSAFKKAKETNTKPAFVAIPTASDVKDLNEIIITIKNEKGVPTFELKTKQGIKF